MRMKAIQRINRFAALVIVAFAISWGTGCIVQPPIPDTVPDFDAATFTNPTDIDNPYFPQIPGTTRTYMGETDEGTERIVIDVLSETKEIMGINCRIVRDRVFLVDVLVEDTHDWFAQDDDGNVWYMGEEVDNYNYGNAGNLIDITHEGAWEAGKDVAGVGVIALPGHVMRAVLMPGDIYSQEYYPGEAEDMGEIVALEVPVTLSDGTQYTCLQTRDFTPLEPDVNEHKYYASGIGLVAEEVVGGGERIELVSVEP